MAAGFSSRMGKFKPVLPFGDSTTALHIVTTLKRLGVFSLVVVTRYGAGELEEHLSHAGVRFVRNERFREIQMFDSMKLRIEATAREYGRIMILPVNMPAIMPDTIRQVLMVDGEIMRIICRGESRHPIMLQGRIAEQLCVYQGGGGLRGAIEDFDGGIMDLEVENEGIYRDVDIREEYQELVGWNYKRGGSHPITPLVRVRLKIRDIFFGPGTEQLLDMVHQIDSIQEAHCRIGLSCSKGNRMIQEVECQLGIPVVKRRIGGMGGGGSGLTDEGKKLIDSYARMVAEVRQSTEQIFLKYFGKGISS